RRSKRNSWWSSPGDVCRFIDSCCCALSRYSAENFRERNFDPEGGQRQMVVGPIDDVWLGSKTAIAALPTPDPPLVGGKDDISLDRWQAQLVAELFPEVELARARRQNFGMQ